MKKMPLQLLKKCFKPLWQLRPKQIAALIFFVIIALYATYQMRGVTGGPELVVNSPEPSSAVTSPLVEVSGQAKRIAHIYLNDTQIFTDENGNFREKLLLPSGYTIIKLKVEDRFGRRVERQFGLVYNQSEEKDYQLISSNYGSKKSRP